MPLLISGLDNEFAASTGANVNSGPGTSTFDYPPNSTKDLLISAHPDDTDPSSFELGDSYEISWGGSGGGGLIANATVIRTDLFPGAGAVVVFEGTDENGALAQIVWTPSFDLEGWYWGHYTPSANPGFYVTDQGPTTYNHICFAADTRVETALGPRPVGGLRVGARLRTLDHGEQTLRWIGRHSSAGIGAGAPVRLAPGVLGNARPLLLSPQHRVLLGGPALARLAGTPEVLVPVKALLGRPGVSLAPCRSVAYVNLLFDRHELIRAEGALCETLFLGPVARGVIATLAMRPGNGMAPLPPGFTRVWDRARDGARPMLGPNAARRLLARLGSAPLLAPPARVEA